MLHAICMAGALWAVLSSPPTVLFQDLGMEHGFRLSATRSSARPVEIGDVMARDTARRPQWRLAQWGTRFALDGDTLLSDAGATRTLANQAKRVTLLPGGIGGEGIVLAVNSGVEYAGSLRRYGEAWPHLLVEQQLDSVPLKGMAALNFALTFRVEKCVPATEAAVDPNLHTAHINAFWTLHNNNRDSPDHLDMLWFGLPLFDARYPIPPGHQALDGGQADATGKFICVIPGERFYDRPVEIGKKHTLRCDMLPLIGEALDAAQKQGFLLQTRMADLALTSFNLGWEAPGPYDCAILLQGLAFEAVAAADSSATVHRGEQ